MPPVHPVDELERLSFLSTEPLARAVGDLAAARALGDDAAGDRAVARVERLVGQTVRLAALLGARRLLIEADAAAAGVSRFQRREACREWARYVPLVPGVRFGEAIDELLARRPQLAFGWRAVQRLYDDEYVFSLARSVDLRVTARVQESLAEALRGGLSPDDARRRVAREGGWPESYAQTVYRTTLSTAYSAGRFAQAADPDVRAVFKAFEFVTAGDVDVRHNHAAAEGLVAGADDPLWERYAPPLGYNCRCGLELVDRWELERRGLIEPGGGVKPYLPPAIGEAGPDPGFAGGRPDRRRAAS